MVHQREESRRKKSLTFMVMPHNTAGAGFKLNLPIWAAISLGIVLFAILASIISAFVFSAKTSARLIHYYSLKSENQRQSDQIKVFIRKTKELEKGVRELEERDQELREMLGLGKRSARTIQGQLKQASVSSLPEAIRRMDELIGYVASKKEASESLKSFAMAAKYKFDYMPSIWPISGKILNGVGMRRHPFHRRWIYHKGVDIPTWEGTPVRAAANGKIIFADFSSGYGLTIAIDHGNGYTTVYAHLDRMLVAYGDRTYKGQIIGEAGNTGLSTGPHLHYEVQKKGKSLDPVRFLDLNIQTAKVY